MEYQCKKCGSHEFHTEVSGNNTGLYCNNCGAWQKWLNKNEIRYFEHSNNVIKARKSESEETIL